MNIILSSRNPSKALQIKTLFSAPALEIRTLDEACIEGEAIEDGTTLKENALKKALYAYEHSDKTCWTMADDTGLFIRALNGEPGIKAARWAGEDVATEVTMNYCLARLEGQADRSAIFRTVVALISPEGDQYFFTGEVEGTLGEQARMEPQPKMPYSPLFKPLGTEKVWAEMTTEEENAISHRGKAFRQVIEFLNEQ